MKRSHVTTALTLIAIVLLVPSDAQARTLESRVNEAFRSQWGRNPSVAENTYWLGRVVRKEKRSFNELVGAIAYHKSRGLSIGGSSASSTGASAPSSSGNTTNKQQLIKDVFPLSTKIWGTNVSNSAKAWWRKRISCGEIKSETALINSMKFHKAKDVQKGRDTICGQKGSTPAGVTRKSVAGFSDHPLGDTVRIGIYNAGGGEVIVTGSGQFQVREGSTKRSTLKKGDTVKVSYKDGLYRVRGAATLDATEPVRLVPVGGTIMHVKSYNDKSSTIADKNYNRFRGTIEVRKCKGCGDVWVINDVRAEHYAKGLAETSASDPEAKEYYKALAIAARSYALYHKIVTGGRQPARGYHIGRTADDQIYRGYEYEILVPRLAASVDATRGTIVTDKDGDKPLITTYFSDSGGKTKTAKEVWGTTASRFRHLQKNVDDPLHQASSCRGHCVGLSAQGAFGFAKADKWSFERILKHYYQHIRLVKAY